MITSPFAIFRPFEKRIRVIFFMKDDDIRDDQTAAQKIGTKDAAGLHQMHDNETVVIRTPTNRTIPADGMITDVPSLALCLRVADCQSFVIYEPKKNILGLLHVGWRGVITGAIPEFFTVLKKEFGIVPAETFVGAGPSLCTRCADFMDPEKELPTVSRKFINGRNADLRGAATEQLTSLGVLRNHIEQHPDCTRCHPELYWTYRGGDRDAVKKGRTNMMVCALWKG